MTGAVAAPVETPRLLLDEARLARNAARLRARCAALGVAFRPHHKTAKCVEVARAAHGGAAGPMTASTLREAEQLAAAGFTDLLLAAVASPGRVPRAVAVGRDHPGTRLLLAADDAAMARLVGEAVPEGAGFGVLAEIDSGEHRSGLDPDSPALLALAEAIARQSPRLRLAGVMTHAGHSYATDDPDALAATAEAERAAAVHAAARLRKAGHAVEVVSVGSTPTLLHARHLDGVTEARAGVSLLWDLAQMSRGLCGWDDLALGVLATVIGHQRGGARPAIVLDAGALALSKDATANAFLPGAGYGLLADARTGERLAGLSVSVVHQEHGTVPVPEESWFARLPVGATVRVMPNHACLTAAGGYGAFHVHGGDGAARAVWPRVDGW